MTHPDHIARLTRCVHLMYADDPAMAGQAVRYLFEDGELPPERDSWPQTAWDEIGEVTSLVAERHPAELVRWATLLSTVRLSGRRPDDPVVPLWYEAVNHWATRVDALQLLSGIRPGTQTTLRMAALEAALEADGYNRAAAVLVIGEPYDFTPPGLKIPDFHLSVRRHTDVLLTWWATATTEQRWLAVFRLVRLDDTTLAPFVPFVIDAVGRSATAEREVRFDYATHPDRNVSSAASGPQAAKLTDWFGAGCWPVWRTIALEGKPAERKQSLRLLWTEGDEPTKDWAWTTAAADPSVTIRRLTERWDPDRAAAPEVSDHGGYDQIEAAARQAMPKKLPKALGWLVEAGLPPLRWADGQPVPEVVWQWWAKVSIDARQVEPGVVVRSGADLLEPSTAQAFALALLQAWIAEDAPSETMIAEATARAAQRKPSPSWSAVDRVLYQMQGNRRPSASSSRGVLALVAALGGPGVTEPVEQYLRLWSRRVTDRLSGRFTQMMALIDLLAWVDDESARALLAAVPTWIYQRRLIRHTWDQITALASRLGTTAAELADRAVVPTGGLDDRGQLALDYGPRSFVAQLNDDLTWTIRDEDGKVRRALPACASRDDPHAVAQAKATLAQVSSTVQDLVTTQAARLHELMLIGHTWPAALWTERFTSHVLMSRLARRLVWQTVGAAPGSDGFRPLDDGTLTDVHDDVVVLDSQTPVRLVHAALLTPAQREMCSDHMHDYLVTALFNQLGVDGVDLPDPAAAELSGLQGRTLD
ncbi:MAG: DUF4132 domain-containing protein, partial [Micrococcales bacterium]|nr:DUF4132 domain-containing protein [Micrococcales bacterium]